jgi:NADH:ubiquinone oxidoreductase subunit 6 (subunit J)
MYNLILIFIILSLILNFLLIFSRKPGLTILFFILIVICLSCLLFLLTLEFLAFILFYIYIGGIMVLSLFFVMMVGDFYPMNYFKTVIPGVLELNIRFIIVLFCFSIGCFFILTMFKLSLCGYSGIQYFFFVNSLNYITDIAILGFLLFNCYIYELIIVCFLLLVTLIGPINLIFFKPYLYKRQVIAVQINKFPLISLRK